MSKGRAHWMDWLVALSTGKRRLFFDGWGDEDALARIPDAVRFEAPPARAEIEWRSSSTRREGGVEITDGAFASPIDDLPESSRRAHVRRLSPRSPSQPARLRPVYVVLASSGDEGFAARERVWRPWVAQRGGDVILLENALYGSRRPHGQEGPNVRTVAEQLWMNVAMVEEGRALIEALHHEGRERVGIAGFSMGGTAAAVIAAVTERPIAATIVAVGRSASPVFTEGLLARGIDFDALGGAEGRERLGRVIGGADLHTHRAPVRPEASVIVGASRDGYVFPTEVLALHAHWPGSELRWLDTGHAGAILRHSADLRSAADDAMARLGP